MRLNPGALAVLKTIRRPPHSPLLAEFVGVMIGDGGVRSRYQVAISYNRQVEARYALWLQRVIKQLFGLESGQFVKRGTWGADIVVSSRMLVDYLREVAGLSPGNKLRNGLDVPMWVWSRRSYQVAVLRGLMDTDGGAYPHRYQVNGKWYTYPKLCFYSGSESLRRSVRKLFSQLGFHPRLAKSGKIFIDRSVDVRRFYEVIGSRHRRHYVTAGARDVQHMIARDGINRMERWQRPADCSALLMR